MATARLPDQIAIRATPARVGTKRVGHVDTPVGDPITSTIAAEEANGAAPSLAFRRSSLSKRVFLPKSAATPATAIRHKLRRFPAYADNGG